MLHFGLGQSLGFCLVLSHPAVTSSACKVWEQMGYSSVVFRRTPFLQHRVAPPEGTRTLVAALRVRYPRRWTTSAFFSVGPEGLEPSPGGLRVRFAAASTLIPYALSVGAEGIEPSTCSL